MRHVAYFILVLLNAAIMPHAAHSQSALTDVPAAFNAINGEPQVLHLKKNHLQVPAGGHLQGIQALSDSVFIITASSGRYSYYLSANGNQLTGIHKISDAPFRHAGGCQIYADHLVVGVEDNVAKDKSNIIDLRMDASGNELAKVVVTEKHGTFKRSTAGAVGMAKTDSRFVIAVGAWDSRDIDFYAPGPKGGQYDLLSTFHAQDGQPWCAYQSLNLLTDDTGHLYMIGFGLAVTSTKADLFEVTFVSGGKANLKLLSSRKFKCRGASFRYGAGIGTTPDGKLVIYSCGRNVSNHTPINIFK